MKKTFKVLALIAILLIASYVLQAQPHPGQQNGGGTVSGERIGAAGAPVGEGINILLLSALAFGAFKFYRTRHKVLTTE